MVAAARVLLVLLLIDGGNSDSVAERAVAEFIRDVLSATMPKCSLVIAHEYVHLPDAFSELIRDMSGERYRFVLVFRVPDNFGVSLSDTRVRDLWDLFERRKKAGECVLHFLTSRTVQGLRNLSLFHAFSITVESFRDHFVLWTRRESTLKALVLDVAEAWTFKVGVSPSLANPHLLEVHTVCFFCLGGHPELRYLGRYPDLLDLNSLANVYPDMSRDMHGKKLHLPFLFRSSLATVEEKIAKEGYWSLDLSEMAFFTMGQKINSSWETYEMQADPNAIERSRMDNGTWMGVIGDVLKGKADFTPVSLYHSDAMSHVNYALPYVFTGFTFVTAHARPVWSWKTIFWPYQASVWLLVALGTIVGVFSAWMLLRSDHESSGPLLSFVAQYLIRCFVEQLPNRQVPPGDAFRLFVAFWLFFAMVITCGYQEMVFGFVAVPMLETMPTTFRELSESKFQIGAPTFSGMAYTLVVQEADLPVHHAIKEKMTLHDSSEECLRRCLEARAACLGLRILISAEVWKIVDRSGHMAFRDQTETALSVYTGIASPKDFPAFSSALRITFQIFESGIQLRWQSNNIFQNFRKSLLAGRSNAGTLAEEEEIGDKEEEERKPLTTKKLFGPFGLLVSGWVFAAAAFLCELFGSLFARTLRSLRGRVSDLVYLP